MLSYLLRQPPVNKGTAKSSFTKLHVIESKLPGLFKNIGLYFSSIHQFVTKSTKEMSMIKQHLKKQHKKHHLLLSNSIYSNLCAAV